MELLVRIAARLYAKKGINCNAVIPGLVLAGVTRPSLQSAAAHSIPLLCDSWCRSETHSRECQAYPPPANMHKVLSVRFHDLHSSVLDASSSIPPCLYVSVYVCMHVQRNSSLTARFTRSKPHPRPEAYGSGFSTTRGWTRTCQGSRCTHLTAPPSRTELSLLFLQAEHWTPCRRMNL